MGLEAEDEQVNNLTGYPGGATTVILWWFLPRSLVPARERAARSHKATVASFTDPAEASPEWS